MNKTVLMLGVVLAAGSTLAAAPMTAGERQRLIAHFEMTEAWLASELAGLSPAQLTFKMTPESWSITEVAEHLAIAEPQYWKNLQDSMKDAATGYKAEATDAGILWYGIDRTQRATDRAKRACRTGRSRTRRRRSRRSRSCARRCWRWRRAPRRICAAANWSAATWMSISGS